MSYPLRFLGFAGGVMMLLAIFGEPLMGFLNQCWADFTAWSLRLLHWPALAVDQQVILGSFQLIVIDACNGLAPLLLVCAALLTWPARWQQRFIGIGIAVFLMMVINWLRLMGLTLLGHYALDYFDLVHDWLLLPLLIMLFPAYVYGWARWADRR